jgi:uncharacterized short protein YbdD (DUF466 family)
MRRETRDREAGGGKREAALPRLTRVLRQIIGAPDYAAYLEHCRHAGHPPGLSEREYVSEFFETKGKIVRCC